MREPKASSTPNSEGPGGPSHGQTETQGPRESRSSPVPSPHGPLDRGPAEAGPNQQLPVALRGRRSEVRADRLACSGLRLRASPDLPAGPSNFPVRVTIS